MSIKPENIKISKSSGTLTVVWQDGIVSEYTLRGLRAACPCAECKGGHQYMGPGSPEMLDLPLPPSASAELEAAEFVGNYAMQLTWKDGHAFGIYSWDYLRELSAEVVKSSPGDEA
jgi:DUF971 family protein